VQTESGQNMHLKCIWINIDEACHIGLAMEVKQAKFELILNSFHPIICEVCDLCNTE